MKHRCKRGPENNAPAEGGGQDSSQEEEDSLLTDDTSTAEEVVYGMLRLRPSSHYLVETVIIFVRSAVGEVRK
jgi:hypothetical protein